MKSRNVESLAAHENGPRPARKPPKSSEPSTGGLDGKDLLEPTHAALRDLFKRTGVRPKLQGLARDLGRELGETIEEARNEARNWP